MAKRNAVASSDLQRRRIGQTLLTILIYVYSYIGETDTKLPNALAQYFYVDKATYPNGFNLTDLLIQGQGDSESWDWVM